MVIHITRGTPLMGAIAFGIIDRGTNLLQVRATSVCNINCTFCSVDGGPQSEQHKVFYEVDCDYLLEEVAKVVALKGERIEINIDSVGEPFCYPHLEKLVQGLRAIPDVYRITIQTNATLWKEIDVDLVNVSLHALDPQLAKELAQSPCFSIEKVCSFIEKTKAKGIDVRLCPVWIPGVNDAEIPKIIRYAKEQGCSLGIQKYEAYRHSRKHSKVKPLNYWKFYRQLESWEEEFGIPLKVGRKDVGVVKAPRVPEVFRKGERVQAKVQHPGWFPEQKLAVARDRCISVQDCAAEEGDLVNVKIVETKNNIYLAECST